VKTVLILIMLAGAGDADEAVADAAGDAIAITPMRPAGGPVELPVGPTGRNAWALGLVLVAIPVGLVIARKIIPGFAARTVHAPVQIIGQCPLGARGTVFALRCGPRLLIVGATGSHLNTLAEFADPDDVDDFLSIASGSRLAKPQPAIARNSASAVDGIRGQLREIRDQVRSWSSDG